MPFRPTKWGGAEQIVRPFVDVLSTPRKGREPSAPAEDQPEAFIEWGKPSTFSGGDFRSDASNNIGFHVDDPGPTERVRLVFPEEGRAWQDIRVENPSDPDQYVIVREATSMAVSGPNGEQILFVNMDRGSPGTVEGSGQTPPAPPPLEEIEA